jgi:membrane-bound ClpP family serine protease
MLLLAALIVVLYVFAFVMTHKGHHGIILAGISLAGALLLTIEIATASPSSFGVLKVVAPLAFLVFAGVLGIRTVATVRKLSARAPYSSPNIQLYGAQGIAKTDLAPNGVVTLNGESWSATSLDRPIKKGATVHVAEVQGLRLVVWSEDPECVEPESTK